MGSINSKCLGVPLFIHFSIRKDEIFIDSIIHDRIVRVISFFLFLFILVKETLFIITLERLRDSIEEMRGSTSSHGNIILGDDSACTSNPYVLNKDPINHSTHLFPSL